MPAPSLLAHACKSAGNLHTGTAADGVTKCFSALAPPQASPYAPDAVLCDPPFLLAHGLDDRVIPVSYCCVPLALEYVFNLICPSRRRAKNAHAAPLRKCGASLLLELHMQSAPEDLRHGCRGAHQKETWRP